MKQSALVIATLFATAEAGSAKERLNRDIRGYLHEGLKFDTKVIKAVHQDHVRVTRAQNELKKEIRQNIEGRQEVNGLYGDAWDYQKSQTVFTPPSKANGEWGNIHYNNTQRIANKWAIANEDNNEANEFLGRDLERYGEQVNRSHEILGNQLTKAWENNGVKATKYFEAGVENAGQAWREDRRPHNLAGVDSLEVREDTHNFIDAVGSAHHAVGQTIRVQQRADKGPDRRIDQANYKYSQQRAQIAEGYSNAIQYEVKNTHFNAGHPGGEGRLHWSNKQEIVDKWSKPIKLAERSNAEWQYTYEKNMEEKMKIHNACVAEAKKVWPAKFAKVEKTWKELAANFNDGPHSLVASRAEIKQGLNDMAHAGAELDNSVIDDFINYNNDTVEQRKEFKQEVGTYIEQKKIINQEYAAAWNYEMQNIHFKNDNGRWSFVVDNQETIIDKWTDAQANDIEARQELKENFINYQNSIAAQKAAFKATAKAQWPKKFAAYKQSVIDFDETMEGPQQRAAMHPHSLNTITDVQQKEGQMIRAQVYDNLNEREQYKFDVRHDLKAYLENTAGAREALKKDEAAWRAGSKRVQDMYAAAWNYQIAQTKFTPATDKKAGHFELENAHKVSNHYRAADQAGLDLDQEIGRDFVNFVNATTPARDELKHEINHQWWPQAEKINRSDVAIIEEVIEFPNQYAKKEFNAFHHQIHNATAGVNHPHFVHPYHNLMAVESSSSLSTNEQIAYGTVFLMAMIAVAALSNKGKAESKSVEFDVEDLEMTNKKESKKQIKKTLKDIMKTSNTKVTLMNN